MDPQQQLRLVQQQLIQLNQQQLQLQKMQFDEITTFGGVSSQLQQQIQLLQQMTEQWMNLEDQLTQQINGVTQSNPVVTGIASLQLPQNPAAVGGTVLQSQADVGPSQQPDPKLQSQPTSFSLNEAQLTSEVIPQFQQGVLAPPNIQAQPESAPIKASSQSVPVPVPVPVSQPHQEDQPFPASNTVSEMCETQPKNEQSLPSQDCFIPPPSLPSILESAPPQSQSDGNHPSTIAAATDAEPLINITRLNPDELQKSEEIGRGSFGVVHKGSYHAKEVAIKSILREDKLTPEEKKDFYAEVEIMEKYRHRAIVEYIGSVLVPGKEAIVTEFCPYGSLYVAMKRYPREFGDIFLRVKCLIDATKAMVFLHESGLIHGDLKPENILVFSLDPHSPTNAKITDFGSTRSIRKALTLMDSMNSFGSYLFMAPELLGGSKTCDDYKHADVYSFSLVMYFTFSGLLPFEGDPAIEQESDLLDTIVSGGRPVIPRSCPESMKRLIQQCWDQEPSLRPSFLELYESLDQFLSSRFNPDEVVKGRPIGRGGFGIVSLGTYRGKEVAIKEVLHQESLKPEDLAAFKKEVEILEAYRHETIVEFIGAIFTPGKLAMVMEYCPYGSLQSAMKKHPEFYENSVLKMKCLVDAANAMEFLHSCCLIHRDLKPDNFLIASLDPNLPVAKLADFGTARALLTFKGQLIMTKGVGTLCFMAPEILRGSQSYDNKVDVFSFSLVVYFVMTGKIPFEGDGFQNFLDFSKAVIDGKRPVLPESCHPELKRLVEKGWSDDPSSRPSFHEIRVVLEKVLIEEKTKGQRPASKLVIRDPEVEKRISSLKRKAAKVLKEMPELATDDSMQWSKGSGSELKQLCMLLKGNVIPLSKLEFLSTKDSNKIGVSGAKMINELLRSNTTLTVLDLKNSGIQTEGATKISESLKENSTLTRLNLSSNWIGNLGVKRICESLLVHDKLIALSLRENNIAMEGSSMIAKYLAATSSLSELDLGSNLVGESGINMICMSLRKNTTLMSLNLEDNEIGTDGGKKLSDVLLINTTLTELDLRRNWIKGPLNWGARDPNNLHM